MFIRGPSRRAFTSDCEKMNNYCPASPRRQTTTAAILRLLSRKKVTKIKKKKRGRESKLVPSCQNKDLFPRFRIKSKAAKKGKMWITLKAEVSVLLI